MKKIILILLIIVSSQTLCQNSFNNELISNLTGGTCSGGLFIESHYLYLGANNTLIVFDISNPEKPQIINRYFLGFEIYNITANDSICVVAAREDIGTTWIFILSIINLENIKELKRFSLDYAIITSNMLLKNNHLIVPTKDQIIFFDISDLPYIITLSTINVGGITYFDLSNQYGIINRFNDPYDSSQIFIYDVSDISNPYLISTYPQSGYSQNYSFKLKDSLLYSFGNDLSVINLGNPDSLFEISRLNLPSYCYSGELIDSIFFLNTGTGQLFTINYNGTGNPIIIDTNQIPAFSTIGIENSNLYVALNQLDTYKISDPRNLHLINVFDFSYDLEGIYYKGMMLYSIDSPNRLRSIDISELTHPFFKSDLTLGFNVDDNPYLGGTNDILILGTHIYDISNKDTIIEISHIDVPSNSAIRTEYCQDSLLFISYAMPSLTEIYNIKDPVNPEFLCSFGRTYESMSMDSVFFLGSTIWTVFDVFDLTDLNNPVLTQSVWTGTNEFISSINLLDQIISLSTCYPDNNKLILYKINDYYNTPIRKGTWVSQGYFSITQRRENQYVFLQHGTNNLSKIDISNLNDPTEVAMLNEYGNMKDFWVRNDTVYVVNNNGLLIIDFTNSINEFSEQIDSKLSNFRLSQNYPNPFNPTTKIKYQLPELSKVKITIYDVLGREVKILVNEEKTAGSYEVEFNGTNLPSGVYFYRIKAGKFSETKKFVLLK